MTACSWAIRSVARGITRTSACKPAKLWPAPAFSPLACWQVEENGGTILVKSERVQPTFKKDTAEARRVVIVGGGAAGFAAAEMLRRHGFSGTIAMLSRDDAAPVDRPNLSKDYLAGSAPEDWMPLRGDDWYAENKVDLQLKTEVTALDAKAEGAHA